MSKHQNVKNTDFKFDLPLQDMQKPISKPELAALQSLMVFIAYGQNVPTETIQEKLEAAFGGTPIVALQKLNYLEALDFLESFCAIKAAH